MSNYNIPVEDKIYPRNPEKVGEFIEDLKNKFYVPKIEEFYIGFEYEEKSSGLWTKQTYDEYSPILNKELCYDYGCKYDTIQDYINQQIIRVKHLNSEDIEDLGFFKEKDEFYTNEKGSIVGGNNDPNYYYVFNNIDRGDSAFSGIIKNKSELKKILKMVGIL